LESGASAPGHIEAMADTLSPAGPDTRIIPGHGSLADRTGRQAARDMLADARSRVKALLDDGTAEQDIVDANPLAVYDSWSWNFITTEVMTRTLIRDLQSL